MLWVCVPEVSSADNGSYYLSTINREMGCGATKSPRASNPTHVGVRGSLAKEASAPLKTPSPAPSLPPTNSNFTSCYRIYEETSRGPGFLCKRVEYLSNGSTFTAKFLSKRLLRGNYVNPATMRRELLTLKALTHPNLVKIIEFYDDENYYIIVQEHCSGGPLLDKITQKQDFSEEIVRNIMRQIVSAVRYCHGKRVMHRDLSPDTILLAEDGSQEVVKITDFGSLSFFDASKRLSGRFGSIYYTAPEVFQGTYDEQCDIWTCGVIMHLLLLGTPPFTGNTDEDVKNAISEELIDFYDQKYEKITEFAKDLMHRLLIKDPIYRIKGEEILTHPWFVTEIQPEDRRNMQNVVTGMGQFRNICRLKDAIFGFMCTHMLSVQDYQDLRHVFESMDRNGDGTLSREEIRSQLVTFLPASTLDSHIDEIFAKVDGDHSGSIDYCEFIKATIDFAKLQSKEVLRKTFQLFDKDSNGSISADELRLVLETVELDEGVDWTALLHEADSNGDGVIDMLEFELLIQRKV